MELLCGSHSLLPGHGVGHHQHLGGREAASKLSHLGKGILVQLKVTHGVHDDTRGPLLPRLVQGSLADLERAGVPFLTVHRDVELLAQRLQLLGGSYPLRVGGHQQRAIAPPSQVEGELGGGRGLAGAFRPHQKDDGWRLCGPLHLALPAAQHFHQLLVHYVDDVLHRGQAAQDLRSQRPLSHPLHELAHHPEVHIGF